MKASCLSGTWNYEKIRESVKAGLTTKYRNVSGSWTDDQIICRNDRLNNSGTLGLSDLRTTGKEPQGHATGNQTLRWAFWHCHSFKTSAQATDFDRFQHFQRSPSDRSGVGALVEGRRQITAVEVNEERRGRETSVRLEFINPVMPLHVSPQTRL